MKNAAMFLALAVFRLSIPDSEAASHSAKSCFFGGLGYLQQNTFIIHNQFDHQWIAASASSPHLILGYILRWERPRVGLAFTGGASWFRPPNFRVDIYPGAPKNMKVFVDYSEVKFSLINLDPSLIVYFAESWEFDFGFCFGIQSTSAVRYTDPFSDPFISPGSQNRRREDNETIAVGGAGLGLTYGINRHLVVSTRVRWIVGESSGANYQFLINDIPMGSASGGGTRYMRQASIGLIYRL